jgi:hypothetical protein
MHWHNIIKPSVDIPPNILMVSASALLAPEVAVAIGQQPLLRPTHRASALTQKPCIPGFVQLEHAIIVGSG